MTRRKKSRSTVRRNDRRASEPLPRVPLGTPLEAMRIDRLALVPPILAAVLSAPGLGLGYFWDDFFFLTKGQSDPAAYLIPNPVESFYRPIPQGLYFRFLLTLGAAGPFAGHLINLILVAAATFLLGALVTSLSDRRAGFVAGMLFATCASVASLVAWISAAQDLFAIVFLLGALHARHAGRLGLSAALAAGALLSKETAALSIPVLVGWDALLGRRPSRVAQGSLVFGSLVLAWILIHPGLRALASAGFQSGTTGYVGLERPERWWDYLIQYLLALGNVPFTGPWTSWPTRLTWTAIAAVAIIVASIRLLLPRIPPGETRTAIPAHRAERVAALLAAPPILLPALIVRPWATYFVALAGVGFAMLAGLFLARRSARTIGGFLLAYAVVGIWFRGLDVPGNGLVISEQRFVEAARGTRQVRDHFRDLAPAFPPGARVLVSVAGTGTLGIHQTLHDGQALRVWYGDPTLDAEQPERKGAPAGEVYLYRVTPDLHVIRIDPKTSRFRSTGGDPDREEIAKPIRSYARGLAASDGTERAVWILGHMARVDDPRLRSYDLRLSAMALRASGRLAEAEGMRSQAPPLTRLESLDMAGKVFAEPTGNPALDSLAFWAFEVSDQDPEALRYLIGQYRIGGYVKPALQLARKLQAVNPGDSLALAVVARRGPFP